MRGALSISLFALLMLLFPVWGCQHETPEGGGAPEAVGVFSDVIEAINQIESSTPKEASRDDDVPRDEWAMIAQVRERLISPRFEYEYPSEGDNYGYEGIGGERRGDALDVILDAEWEEYRNLSASIIPGSPDIDITKAVEDSLVDFYKDLPGLMADVPDTLRERVMHIVVLRYYNTILRAGVDPRLFIEPPRR